MSWIGGSLSSLTGQLSNLTKDILTEGTEEISDPATELRLAKEKILQLDTICNSQRQENERLKSVVRDLEERSESSELQINTISREYRTMLESREKEVNSLKQQHHDLLEFQASSAVLGAQREPTTTSHTAHSSHSADGHGWNSDGFDFVGEEGGWDFDDSIRLQRETNQLRSELKQAEASAKHWQTVAGQLGQKNGENNEQHSSNTDVLALEQKIKSLEQELSRKGEELRHQAASLHDHHREKVATLRTRHQGEMLALQDQLTRLEAQLAADGDGSSSSRQSATGTLPESDRQADQELQRQLTQALQDKEKSQNALHHLEGVLEELQQEVLNLQEHHSGDGQEVLQTQVLDLTHKLEESEKLRVQAESDLKEKKELEESLQKVKSDHEGSVEEAEALVDKLGDPEHQRITAELFNCLEKENLLLKEEKLKLEEQVTLFEKSAVTGATEKQKLQQKISSLKTKLRKFGGGDADDGSDTDTLDTDFTSVQSGSDVDPTNALHIGQEEIDRELQSLQSQLAHQTDALATAEMERADWQMEREALEDVVTDLRKLNQHREQEIQSLKSEKKSSTQETGGSSPDQQVEALQAEISSLQGDKLELETALEELDSQHTQALDQLIAHRNSLQNQLEDCQREVQERDQTITQLEQTITQFNNALKENNHSSSNDTAERKELEEKCARLERKLSEAKKQSMDEGRNAVNQETEELKEKLHKGGLVINDLHMDKKELQDELKKSKEEITAKVEKLRELREENNQLTLEKKELENRQLEFEEQLTEMEGEVEKWQSLNEEKQVKHLEAAKVNQDNEMLREKIQNLEQELQSPYRPQEDFLQQTPSNVSHDIFEGENKVLKSLEEDHKLIHELREQVQKLYDDKKRLKENLWEKNQLEVSLHEKLSQTESEREAMEEQVKTFQKEKADEKQDLESKLVEAGRQHQELMTELASRDQQLSNMEGHMEGQRKKFEEHIEEQKAAQNMGEESLQEEVQKLLNLQRERDQEIEVLQEKLKTGENLAQEVAEKDGKITELLKTTDVFKQEISIVKDEISRLESMCNDKDHEIEALKSRMSQFDIDLEDIESSVSDAEKIHELELSGKESELAELKNRNTGLERSLSQMQVQFERFSSQQEQSSSEEISDVNIGSETSDADKVSQLSMEVQALRRERDNLQETLSQLEINLSLSDESVTKLNEDLTEARRTIQCHEAGISDLNNKTDEQRKELEKTTSDLSQQKSSVAVLRQSSVDKDTMLVNVQRKLSYLLTILSPQQIEQLKSYTVNSGLPAIGYTEMKAIEFSDSTNKAIISENEVKSDNHQVISEVNDYIVEDIDEVAKFEAENNRFESLEKELEDLLGRLQEKDKIVTELRKSNSSLLSLLENKGSGDKNINMHQKVNPVLETELHELKAEREQMLAVISEKSRENSSQKAELHRLMEVVAAGQAALEKLQAEQRQNSPPRDVEGEDDMKREALANMARLVRDRETEIEALKQKNETLLAVLQEPGETQAAAHLGPVLREKEVLTQQMATLTSEREQLVACITQKHSEALTYHAETQRLAALLADVQQNSQKIQAEYSTLVLSFEDKSKALVSAQAELMEIKQKLQDLEVRHGELIQRSNSENAPGSPTVSSLEVELNHLRLTESDLRSAVTQREEKLQTLTHKVNTLEDSLTSKEAECAHLKKHADNSKFQLSGLMTEIADLKREREQRQQKSSEQNTETTNLRDSIGQLTLSVKEKEAEMVSLQEQVDSLTSLLQQQQGEQGQVSQLMKDLEHARSTSRQLQQERDQQAMLAEQRAQDLNALRAEMVVLKDKEFKMSRELERLRGHLIEIEEGYTQEALESEEREKDLRNRLAAAEEQLQSSTSQVELASQESVRHIEALQQQLEHVASQRDSAFMQVASIQDQCQQYATSLGNLQLVLEHFQKEKDTAVAAETERYEEECNKLKVRVEELNKELQATRDDLTDALDGLEAASRLSEQLDRKQEALTALKEEVQLRENALYAAEEEIKKLNTTTEAKVDKTLMHNMVMTWLTSPETKRPEIVHLIGNVLSFSPEDFKKIEAVQGHGGIFSLFRRSAPSTPTKERSGDQSFSQLFVNFLEKESTPAPSPVRLPAEAMAAEAQHRHHKPGPAFNPFTAPRHVTHAAGGERATSPHLLMSHDTPAVTPLFAPLTSTTAAKESAILKDVLGKS